MSALQSQLGSRARIWHWEAVIDPVLGHEAVHLLEVFNPCACKWGMVQRWCASHGRDASLVVAIGDGLNDVSIVKRAPLGVAMGNADPRVLAVADHVAGHHDENGVAQVIDALLSGELGVAQ
jgi:hydroxymethylpyrimidine pyrophosphatase-like HAD family hydrolase